MKYVFGFLVFSVCMLALALVLYNKASSERDMARQSANKESERYVEMEKKYLMCRHANMAAKMYIEHQDNEIENYNQLLEQCDCER